MGSYCASRVSIRRIVCAAALGATAGLLVLPTAFGQGAGVPPKSFATPEEAVNSLAAAYVDAQREYHQQDRSGSGTREYAQRFRSTPGRKDGLYWEGASDKAEGPFAALVETALKEGYQPTKEGELPVYRGYVYKMLTAQGPRARGGAREYIVNGRMTGGFALVAFPVRYGVSGIMTFMVNQDGVIYQKDLGPKTGEAGRQMARFNPEPGWTKGQGK